MNTDIKKQARLRYIQTILKSEMRYSINSLMVMDLVELRDLVEECSPSTLTVMSGSVNGKSVSRIRLSIPQKKIA